MKKHPLDETYIPPEIIELINSGAPMCDLDEIFTLATKKIGKLDSYEVKCMRHELKIKWIENAKAYKNQNKEKIKKTYSKIDVQQVITKLKNEIQEIHSNCKKKNYKNKRPLGGYAGVYFLSSRNKGKSIGKKVYSWLE